MGHFLLAIALVGVALRDAPARERARRPARRSSRRARRCCSCASVYVLTIWRAGPRHARDRGRAARRRRRSDAGSAGRSATSRACTASSVDVLVVLTLVTRRRARAHRARRASCSTPRRSRSCAMVAQGVLGYVQYFEEIPAVLVGFHVFGAVLVFVCGAAARARRSRRRSPTCVDGRRRRRAQPGARRRGVRGVSGGARSGRVGRARTSRCCVADSSRCICFERRTQHRAALLEIEPAPDLGAVRRGQVAQRGRDQQRLRARARGRAPSTTSSAGVLTRSRRNGQLGLVVRRRAREHHARAHRGDERPDGLDAAASSPTSRTRASPSRSRLPLDEREAARSSTRRRRRQHAERQRRLLRAGRAVATRRPTVSRCGVRGHGSPPPDALSVDRHAA